MPDFSPISGSLRIEAAGADTANSRGTAVTSSASLNTKGSYTQLLAASSFQSAGLLLFIGASSGSLGDILVDLAVGGSGSEAVFVSNLLHSITKAQGHAAVFYIPVSIPAGSRIAARLQATGSSIVVHMEVLLLGSPFILPSPLSRVTSYGPNTADSGGVGLDPGGTAHTKGSYSQITATTTNAIRAMFIVIGGGGNAGMTTADWLIDVAIGAAASEQIILPNMHLQVNSTDDRITPEIIGPIAVNIPAGTRLSARAQCSITDATDRLLDITIYGLD